MPLCYGNTQKRFLRKDRFRGKSLLTVCIMHTKITFHFAKKPFKISKIITRIAFSLQDIQLYRT